MEIEFFKYHGTGNDFIMIDNRRHIFDDYLNQKTIKRLCDRRFGIGADGFILLGSQENYDFTMLYYNSDGRESTLCGNGGRCITAFAKRLGLIDQAAEFQAIDGTHHAIFSDDLIRLKMQNVDKLEHLENFTFLNTGSPHYVQFRQNIAAIDIAKEGSHLRHHSFLGEAGANANFVHARGRKIQIRTYERGVEGETLSCGTGAVAAAIATFDKYERGSGSFEFVLETPGGQLHVSFETDGKKYWNIWLSGAATFVFSGTIEL